MGSGQPDGDVKMELDDSGCVQDESPPTKPQAEENGYVGQANLLDLSDDVLLYILRYCAPHDLKALGFSCPRLGSLVLERSLWTSVDARGVHYGRLRTLWLMEHALHRGTRALKLTGFAKYAEGCQGHSNQTRKQAAQDKKRGGGDGGGGDGDGVAGGDDSLSEEDPDVPALLRERRPIMLLPDGDAGRLHMNPLHYLPRLSSSPNWPDSDSEDSETDCEPSERCKGPVFTLGRRMLKRLRSQCPLLTTIYLEDCNINCNKIPLSAFPPTLRCLSLRGSRCYNLPLEKSYFFKIQDYLPHLEYLELSQCSWLEPASLLPLSKLPALRVLRARRCPAMQEFVAYISLATRYGFPRLEVLDLRGSPVGDSEVAALGWLPELRELYLSPPPPSAPAPASAPAPPLAHTHYTGRARRKSTHADLWEIQVPEYYSTPRHQEDVATEQSELEDGAGASADNTTTQQSANDVNGQGIPPEEPERYADREESTERKRKTETEESDSAGPSKRPKEESVDRAIASIQNASTSVTRGNGFVTFRRTVFNNVTDINRRLNSSDHDHAGSAKDKHKKDDEKQSHSTNNSTFSTRVHIDINQGAGSSNSQFRVNDRETEDKEASSNKCDGSRDTAGEDTMDADSEPPAKKSRLSDAQHQENLEKMSTSSSEGHSESMDVNVEGDALNREASREGQSGSPRLNASSVNPSTCNSPANSTGQSESPLGQDSASAACRCLSRLRRSVGLEASPPPPPATAATPSQRHTSPRHQLGSSLRRTSDVGPSCSRSNQVGSSSSNDARIPAPSMDGSRLQPVLIPDIDDNPPQYVRFRRNEDPIIIQCPARQEEQAEPRHHVLYVNLGQQLHAVYRLLPSRPMFQSRNQSLSTERLDASSLVTDISIRRFGRADGENVNVVNIGPNGPQFIGRDTSGRPNRSNLRVLSATGYRNITNRSLVHLATAAPYLEYIDFTETSVTEDGVEQFRSIRPDCQVDFSQFKDLSDEE